jgi:DNA mismatch repair protein MutS2
MNEKTQELLEFSAVLEKAAGLALSEEAADLIRAAKPFTNSEDVNLLKDRVQTVLACINRAAGDGEVRAVLPNIGSLLPRLEVEGASLGAEEAYALGIFVERGENFRQFLSQTLESTLTSINNNTLSTFLSDIPDCSAVSREVFRILERDGKLRDLPELRDIQRRIQSLGKELETAAVRYTASEESRRMLQSTVPSQRDGRLVLAVKANFRGRVKGIVHEVSATGQTLFIEPEDVVEKNNEILIEQRRLDTEIRRLFRELTVKIAERRQDLALFHERILYLETLRARARYALNSQAAFAASSTHSLQNKAASLDSQAAFAASTIQSGDLEAGSLILKQARHPLLGSRAVPIDFEMNPGIRTVIITGPNTGGKTVALKTLGLFALMNQAGFAIPAEEGSVLPIFDGVYADIGDEQSLSQSLSTFSAHMTNIAAILNSATDHSLLLLDELGSGTDPEEGSAIAMAILDHCVEKGCRLITTTHHGILKNFGYTKQGVENASVDFDSRTLSPTYRIVMGIPGESRAVDIAGRNGIPETILSSARTYLAEERADVSALIRGLKEKHRELDAANERRKAEELRLQEERRRSDLKELRLRQKELEVKAGGMGKFRELLRESRKTLENLVREVKEGELSREKTLRVKAFLGDLEAAVNAEDAALSAEEELFKTYGQAAGGTSNHASDTPDAAASLAPGVEVLCREGRRRGRLVRQDRKGRWIVEIGSLKLSMSEGEFIPLPPSMAGAKKTVTIAPVDYAAGGPRVQPELSLLGMRLTEALDVLQKQIDAAAIAGVHEFAVVHGKGDGILQRGVHDFLKTQPPVADYYFSRPELGGFGRTEVILKG